MKSMKYWDTLFWRLGTSSFARHSYPRTWWNQQKHVDHNKFRIVSIIYKSRFHYWFSNYSIYWSNSIFSDLWNNNAELVRFFMCVCCLRWRRMDVHTTTVWIAVELWKPLLSLCHALVCHYYPIFTHSRRLSVSGIIISIFFFVFSYFCCFQI